MAGDFNHHDVSGPLGDAGLVAVPTNATRGGNTLDVEFKNFGGDVKEAKVLEPLQANDGSRSDHRCVYVETAFQPEKDFEWQIKWVRKKTKSGMAAFARDMKARNWDDLRATVGPDAKV